MLEQLRFRNNFILRIVIVKNGAKIFRLNNRPGRSEPHKDHHTRLIEYDDRMRQEEQKYSRLLAELNRFQWLAKSNISTMSGNNVISFSTAEPDRNVHRKNVYILRLEKRDRDGE
jgi:hypothetical protein